MTIIDLIKELQKLDYDVQFRKRSDGGYLITKINGQRYKGAAGNIRAREITGTTISQARAVQLARIRPPKKIAPSQRKKAPLPEDLLKLLRKTQREWRKKHPDIRGSISMRGLRYQYETYGRDQAIASLDKAYRYSQGLAYIDNVEWLLQRLEGIQSKLNTFEQAKLNRLIEKIKLHELTFKEAWISEIYEEIYELEKGAIDVDELARRIDGIMN